MLIGAQLAQQEKTLLIKLYTIGYNIARTTA